MAKDIKLPTVGSTNWGSNLNAYLMSIDSKISGIENALKSLKDEGIPSTAIGKAGSGFVGNPIIKYTSSTKMIDVSGEVFIGGGVDRTYNLNNSYSLNISGEGYFYVYLLYGVGTGNFELEYSSILNNDYTKILLGSFNNYASTFTPILYTSAKTIGEHENDRMVNRRVELEDILGGSFITFSQYGIRNIVLKGLYTFYDDGIGYEEGRDYTDNSPLYVFNQDYKNIGFVDKPWDINTYYLEDETLAGGSKITTKQCGAITNSGNVLAFRLLATNDGRLILQRVSESQCPSELSPNLIYREHWLYNLKFTNDLTWKRIDDAVYSLNASDFVEILRFGYNRIEEWNDSDWGTEQSFNIDDIYNTSLSIFGPKHFITLVYSQGSGLSPAQNLGATLERPSTIQVGTGDQSVVFSQMEGGSTEEFQIEYLGTGSISADMIKIDKRLDLEREGKASPLLYSKTKLHKSGNEYVGVDSIDLGFYDKDNNLLNKLVVKENVNEAIGNFDQYYLNEKDERDNEKSSLSVSEKKILLSSKEVSIGAFGYPKGFTFRLRYEKSEGWPSGSSKAITIKMPANLDFPYGDYAIYINRTYYKPHGLSDDLYDDLSEKPSISNLSCNIMNVREDGIHMVVYNTTVEDLLIQDWWEFEIELQDSIPSKTHSLNYLKISPEASEFNHDIKMNEGKVITYLSDARLKNIDNKIQESYLNTVLNTPVYSYTYKNAPLSKQVGIIAQDLQNNLTSSENSFITTYNDDPNVPNKLMLNETKLVYILWKAIQEQQEQIEKLQNRLQELDN